MLQRAAVVLSASIQPKQQSGTELVLRPLNIVHDTQVICVRLWTKNGVMLERRFDGQPGSITESRRAPLELIRADLEKLATASRSTEATPELRAMLVDAWPPQGTLPSWIHDRLFAVAAALPSAQVAPLLLPGLDEEGEQRVRAINALAGSAGVDLRRDAAGRLRPVEDIAEAYRQLLQRE